MSGSITEKVQKRKKKKLEEETFEEISWGLDIFFSLIFSFFFYFSLLLILVFGLWSCMFLDRSEMEARQDETVCKETDFEWELDERVG